MKRNNESLNITEGGVIPYIIFIILFLVLVLSGTRSYYEKALIVDEFTLSQALSWGYTVLPILSDDIELVSGIGVQNSEVSLFEAILSYVSSLSTATLIFQCTLLLTSLMIIVIVVKTVIKGVAYKREADRNLREYAAKGMLFLDTDDNEIFTADIDADGVHTNEWWYSKLKPYKEYGRHYVKHKGEALLVTPTVFNPPDECDCDSCPVRTCSHLNHIDPDSPSSLQTNLDYCCCLLLKGKNRDEQEIKGHEPCDGIDHMNLDPSNNYVCNVKYVSPEERKTLTTRG